LCNGDVLPEVSQTATAIEFTHRIMSGGALIAVAVLFVWATKAFAPGHPARRWAAWSGVFILTEALIGAALVLLGHVAKDESLGRVYSLATHLVNTFLLLASLALTAWWARETAIPADATTPSREGGDFNNKVPRHTPAAIGGDLRNGQPSLARPVEGLAGRNWKRPFFVGRGSILLAVCALVVVAVAGAITALGDTLFPPGTLAQGFADDFSAASRFLVRLRVIHPALALAAAALIAGVAIPAFRAKRKGTQKTLAGLLLALVFAQVAVGILTVLLRAPVAMQLVHLLIADCLWISLVLFSSENLRQNRYL
jgi:heme a synthase